MKRDQSVAIDAMDVSNISLQDYAVKVDYLPRDVTAEELGTFFSKFGKVHQVTLGTDVSGVIGKHRRRGEMVNTREELGAKFAKSRGKNFIVGEQIRVHDKAMQQLEKALVEATNNARAGRGNRVTRCGAFPITTHRLCDHVRGVLDGDWVYLPGEKGTCRTSQIPPPTVFRLSRVIT